MSAFRVALRISRRNAWRSKRRSALILAMIALPVLLATVLVTSTSNGGTNDPNVTVPLGQADVIVSGGPADSGQGEDEDPPPDVKPFTQAQVVEMFGPGTRAVRVDEGFIRYLTPQGFKSDMVRQENLRDPLVRGTYRLITGRLPTAPGEIVVDGVNDADAANGRVTVGQTFFAGESRVPLRVVGIMATPQGWPPDFVAFPGSLPDGLMEPAGYSTTTVWMVDAPKPVSSADAARLTSRGASVNGPGLPDGTIEVGSASASDEFGAELETVPWTAMMLLEVVLLAGPAFVVGRRRREREFALVGAQGGSPRQLKRIALADGLLFGTVAAVIGVAAGIGVAVPVTSWYQGDLGSLSGSLQVPWVAVAIVMAMGVVAGLLAALAPAQHASRTDVVAVLAGRRAPARDRAGRPVLGVALIAAGLAGTAAAAGHGASWVAAAALVTQLGFIAVLPRLIASAGRLAGALPFSLRFAVRDAARNRGRTVPALSAVMVAVTLFTALGVAWRSNLSSPAPWGLDSPQGPAGALWIRGRDLGPELWDRVRTRVHAELPGVPVIEARSPVSASGEPLQVSDRLTDKIVGNESLKLNANWVDPSGNGGLLVGDERLLRYVLGRDDPAAAAALRAGEVVALNPVIVHNGKADFMLATDDGPDEHEQSLPAIVVRASGEGRAHMVVSPEAIKKQGYATETALLLVDPAEYRVSPATAQRLLTDLDGMSSQITGRLEGPPGDPDDTPLLVLLGAAAAVLVLGMTLVATSLAVAEARTDLAVMSAVGAAPRVRRAVKAGQALVIALGGTVIGVVAGLVAGVASRWPEPHTGAPQVLFGADGFRIPMPEQVAPVIIVPWSLIALLVVGLPLLAALVCGVFTRSRFPALRRRVS
ncbi:hypothetical protein Pth03_41320 [Planotetraspora thailandica]|uniref:ABC3 transporter permease C-terminal domain-containing protein n=1 Tax=Planotetraspora thailandica TaxID=487172 RepID=A0A8J3XZ12_9ACTN|nr:FtsX-like permease family protein [Planotetraspora thailandica]GII55743.1 hypothetical protein Pth03_41320 [Planotetraspora thailandica]